MSEPLDLNALERNIIDAPGHAKTQLECLAILDELWHARKAVAAVARLRAMLRNSGTGHDADLWSSYEILGVLGEEQDV